MGRGASSGSAKRIYEYGNFRDFLKDFYEQEKQKDFCFSFRAFSALAGFKSKSFLKLVIQGKRNLTADSINRLAVAVKLNKDETFFFRNLVLLTQASTAQDRQTFAGQLLKSREYRKLRPLSEAQYHYMSHWYFIVIRELVGLPQFQEDPQWIASRVNPPISPTEAQNALKELAELGLVKRNAEGRLVQTDEAIATPDEVVSAYAAEYHREMLKKASESIDRFSRDLREISSVTFGISKSNVQKIKEIIYRCRKEIVELSAQDTPRDSVYQLGFQVFPLALDTIGEKKK
jgi:uncharacterized protein (TIGR02147 family)